MEDALAMYKAVLYELDQFQSPEFDVEDFNYFINVAVEKWLKAQIEQYELTQLVSDKISVLVDKSPDTVLNSTNATDVRIMDLPSDYRHLINCLVRLRQNTATPAYTLGYIRSDYTKRITGDGEAAVMDNLYLMPLITDSDVRIYHRVLGSKLSILIDTPKHPQSYAVINSVQIEYLKRPQRIELSDDGDIVTDTVFPPHANVEIVKTCAALFLENNGSQRFQSHTAVNS